MKFRLIFAVCVLALTSALGAQNRVPIREYTTADEMITMSPATTFGKAMEIFGNAFKRFANKPLVFDGKTVKVTSSPTGTPPTPGSAPISGSGAEGGQPKSFGEAMEMLGSAFSGALGGSAPTGGAALKSMGGGISVNKPIGITIPMMYWKDAFELVLKFNNHWYQEFPDYARVYELESPTLEAAGTPNATQAITTREVEISAIFFEANRTMMDQMGIDWSTTFTNAGTTLSAGINNVGLLPQGSVGTGAVPSTGGTGSTTGGGTSGYGMTGTFKTAGENLSFIAALRAFESRNLGELISRPSITVRSGEIGRIQVGADFSVKQRDFSGNTIDKFFSTGTIIDVTPTVMSKDTIEFVHLKITAERSSALPDPVSTVINKTQASTSVILIDQEETVVGGLFTNDVQQIRRGIPFLKDLPWWIFGLRYLFGYDENQVTKKELIIILKARIMPSIEKRVAEKMQEIKEGQKVLQFQIENTDKERQRLIDQIDAATEKR